MLGAKINPKVTESNVMGREGLFLSTSNIPRTTNSWGNEKVAAEARETPRVSWREGQGYMAINCVMPSYKIISGYFVQF